MKYGYMNYRVKFIQSSLTINYISSLKKGELSSASKTVKIAHQQTFGLLLSRF